MTRFVPRAALAVAAAVALAVSAAPAASAQLPLPVPPEIEQAITQAQAGSAQADYDARTSIGGALESAGITPPPGFVPPPPAAPTPSAPPDETPQSPCPRTADACVDLGGERTWLQADGRLSYGPVRMSHGKAGWETPTGTYQVTRKVRHEVSRLFDNAPMPYSVYFVGGIAFHEGDPAIDSHGCIRMDLPAAATYFEHLEVGDTVVVF
ncbi:L,D-transpeptidase [Dietzia sp. NPDC055343]